MTKSLTPTQLRSWEEDGYIAPLRFVEADRIAAYRNALEEAWERTPAEVSRLHHGAHAFAPWLDTLHPRFLDALEDLLGPDFLYTTSSCRVKEPGTGAYAGWHQDAFITKYDPIAVTCLFAVTDCTVENGCVEVVPGSHRWGLLTHGTNTDRVSILSQAQRITQPFDESRAVPIELKAGEATIFSYLLIHGSGVNRSQARRIAFFVDVCPTHARRVGGPPIRATLLRGSDAYGHFTIA